MYRWIHILNENIHNYENSSWLMQNMIDINGNGVPNIYKLGRITMINSDIILKMRFISKISNRG